MSEERISAVENKLVHIEDAVLKLTTTVNASTLSQALIDNSLKNLVLKMDEHYNISKNYERAIDRIDENIQDMAVSRAGEPIERMRELKLEVKPIWDKIRETEKEISYCKKEVKEELQKESRTIASLILILVGVIASISAYTYVDTITEIRNKVNQIDKVQRAAP